MNPPSGTRLREYGEPFASAATWCMSEEAEAEVAGHLTRRFSQSFFRLELADVPDERLYPIEHPRCAVREGFKPPFASRQ